MFSHDIEVADKSALPHNAHSIQRLQDNLVSSYAHHGTLLMTITLVTFFLVTRLLSDHVFPKLIYRTTFNNLAANHKRRFTNHHVLIAAKVLMIALALYPYMAIVLGPADFSTPFVAGATTTMGDVTMVATSIFIGMYLNELLYVSSDVHFVSVFHHLGAVVVASVMVTRNVRWEVEANTTAYTVLVMTYGIFDILAGLWPRPVMVLRTVWPEKHRMNMWCCYVALGLTVLGTIGETIVAMFLFKVNFSGWAFSVQVATPILHVVFMVAQSMSSRIMWTLGRKHQRQLAQLQAAGKDVEMPGGAERREAAVELTQPSSGRLQSSETH